MSSRNRHGVLAAAVACAAVALVGATPAPADAASQTNLTGDLSLTVTHPVLGPVTVPAGAVCQFAVGVTFPDTSLTRYTWSDSSGRPVFAIETGTMYATFTNESTGATVTRDMSGTGYYDYPDADTTILSGTEIAVFNGAGDTPPNELLFANGGFMSVKAETVDGVTHKTVLVEPPTAENICDTI